MKLTIEEREVISSFFSKPENRNKNREIWLAQDLGIDSNIVARYRRRYLIWDAICKYCKKTFKTSLFKMKYCSKCIENNKHENGMVEVVCKQCGITFTAKRVQKRLFCSMKCYDLYKGRNIVWVVCQQCGKKIRASSNRNRKYCSQKCYGIAERERPRRTKTIELICKYCGEVFKVYPSNKDAMFCSQTCQYNARVQSRREVVCQQCGKKFQVNPSQAKKRLFCNSKCYDAFREKRKIELICKCCGKTFKVIPSLAKKGKKFCSIECFSFSRSYQLLRVIAKFLLDFKSSYHKEYNKLFQKLPRNEKQMICRKIRDIKTCKKNGDNKES